MTDTQPDPTEERTGYIYSYDTLLAVVSSWGEPGHRYYQVVARAPGAIPVPDGLILAGIDLEMPDTAVYRVEVHRPDGRMVERWHGVGPYTRSGRAVSPTGPLTITITRLPTRAELVAAIDWQV